VHKQDCPIFLAFLSKGRSQKSEATMSKANFTNVDEYISAQPRTAQVALKLVRSTLRKALPEAEEVISYKIPAYQLHSGIVLYFAAWAPSFWRSVLEGGALRGLSIAAESPNAVVAGARISQNGNGSRELLTFFLLPSPRLR
jgi:hypothetical protein